MQSAGLKDIKDELKQLGEKELMELISKLARFKKENKELLTYELFLSADEVDFRNEIKFEIDEDFSQLNSSSFYLLKKGIRKSLRNVKKAIRYSKNKITEIELLTYFLFKLADIKPGIWHSTTLLNLYNQQRGMVIKAIDKIEPDLQHDYLKELDNITLEE